VLAAEHLQSGQKVAIKMVDMSTLKGAGAAVNRVALEDEVELLHEISAAHLGIVELFAVHALPEQGQVCMVMEYCDGGELFGALEAAREDVAFVQSVVAQMCAALAFMHSRGIAHRDIKPENVLLMTDRSRADWVKLAVGPHARVHAGPRAGQPRG
jgi:serine/threonine protein kinase